MRAQYGLKMYGDEFREMKWAEFKALLSGIGPDTPLGRIVQIRSETDKDILAKFTPSQRKIGRDWQKRNVKNVSEEDMKNILEGFKNAFINMAGGEREPKKS